MKWFVCLLAASFMLAIPCPARSQEKTMEERVKALEGVLSGWSLYGSIRFATFYNESDSDFTGDTYAVTRVNPSATPTITEPDQQYTQWALANNSRFGVNVDRDDNFSGRVELGLRNDASVSLRLGYATYAWDKVTFLWGQDYTPLSSWDYSTQVYFSDNNLEGWGIISVDGKRIPQVKFTVGGLQAALVYPKGADELNLEDDFEITDATAEVLWPNIQAKYRLDMGTFFADVFGGIGSYDVKSEVAGIDETVTSYAYGVGGGVKLDPVYAKAMIWAARNGEQLSLSQADAAGASFDENYSVIDDDNLGWAVILGIKIADYTAEAGYGYVSSEQDVSGAGKDDAQNYYANVTIPVVQNAVKTAKLLIVPEAGVYDYLDDAEGNDQGKIWYAGAKWQVSF